MEELVLQPVGINTYIELVLLPIHVVERKNYTMKSLSQCHTKMVNITWEKYISHQSNVIVIEDNDTTNHSILTEFLSISAALFPVAEDEDIAVKVELIISKLLVVRLDRNCINVAI